MLRKILFFLPCFCFSFLQVENTFLVKTAKNHLFNQAHQTFMNYVPVDRVSIFHYGSQRDYQSREFNLRIFLTKDKYNYWLNQIRENISGPKFFGLFFGYSRWWFKDSKWWLGFRTEIQEVLFRQADALHLSQRDSLLDALKAAFDYNPWFNFFSDVFTALYLRTYTFKKDPDTNYQVYFRKNGVVLQIPFALNSKKIWVCTSDITMYPQIELIVISTLILNYFWYVSFMETTRPWDVQVEPPVVTIKVNPNGSKIKDNIASIMNSLYFMMSIPSQQENYIAISKESYNIDIPPHTARRPAMFFVDFYQKLPNGQFGEYTYKRFYIISEQ